MRYQTAFRITASWLHQAYSCDEWLERQCQKLCDFVLLNVDGDCSFEDLDNLLTNFSMHDQHEFSMNIPWEQSCRDKPEENVASSASLNKEAKDKRRKEKKRGSLPSPASRLQRQGEACAASNKKAMVQHMQKERAQHTSLLVEHRHQPATASTAAPSATSLVQPKQAAAMGLHKLQRKGTNSKTTRQTSQ